MNETCDAKICDHYLYVKSHNIIECVPEKGYMDDIKDEEIAKIYIDDNNDVRYIAFGDLEAWEVNIIDKFIQRNYETLIATRRFHEFDD